MGALEGEPLMAIGSAPPGGEQPGSAWGWGSVGSITVSQQRSRCALAPPPPSHVSLRPTSCAPPSPPPPPPPKPPLPPSAAQAAPAHLLGIIMPRTRIL
jgi:hypothetical protein